jgi:enamine deaminase RidA (YjgF/YER057c/UK114 family)
MPPPETPAFPPSPWQAINPPGFPHQGYSNAVVSGPGRHIAVAGQIDMGADGKVRHPGDLVAQAKGAFENIRLVLAAAGAGPQHLVRLRFYVADAAAYAAQAKELGAAYRAAFGRWFPAMALVQVARLYDAHALIEVEADAVLPDKPA